jgi:hypothetical protein
MPSRGRIESANAVGRGIGGPKSCYFFDARPPARRAHFLAKFEGSRTATEAEQYGQNAACSHDGREPGNGGQDRRKAGYARDECVYTKGCGGEVERAQIAG